jgi:hypothetical protein
MLDEIMQIDRVDVNSDMVGGSTKDSGHSLSHPSSVMSRADARHQNLPGSFNGFFASSRHSEIDPEADKELNRTG